MVKRYSREKIFEMLKVWMQENKRLPNYRDLDEDKNLPAPSTVRRYFSTLEEALKELSKEVELPDYDREKSNKSLSKEEILTIVKNWMKKHDNEFPRTKDFRGDKSLPTPDTLNRKVGGLLKLRELLGLGEFTTKISKAIKEDALLRKYAEDLSYGSIETYKTYLNTLVDLRGFLKSKNKEIADLNVEILVEYFEILKTRGAFNSSVDSAKPNSPRTLKDKYRNISAFLTWLIEDAEEEEQEPAIKRSTIKKIKRIFKRRGKSIIGEIQDSKRSALSGEQVAEIRGNLKNPYLRNLFDIGLNLGLRVSEYSTITLDKILLDDTPPHIHVKGKGGKVRTIVLTSGMVKLIEKQLALRKLDNVKHNYLFYSVVRRKEPTKRSLQDYFEEISKIGGVNFTSHLLRYTMSTLMQDKQVPKYVVKQRLGHAGDITDLYSRVSNLKRYNVLEEKVGVL